jgi:hypothetical protein
MLVAGVLGAIYWIALLLSLNKPLSRAGPSDLDGLLILAALPMLGFSAAATTGAMRRLRQGRDGGATIALLGNLVGPLVVIVVGAAEMLRG